MQDHEFGALQGAAHGRLVGQALGRIGAGDPQGLDFAVGCGLKHLHGRFAGLGRHVRHAPQPGHFGAVRGVGQITVGAEQIGQAADLAPAHGVGLTGQRKRPGPRLADLPGGQMQVDEGRVLGGAAAALVQALAVQAQCGCAGCAVCVPQAAEPARGLQQVGAWNATVLRHPIGGGVLHRVQERIKAVGMGIDIGAVLPTLRGQDMQHAVEQQHVGPGLQGQHQVGNVRGMRTPRIDHDDLHLRVGALGIFQPPKQDRVRKRRIGPGNEHALGVLQIVVARRRCVCAQGLFVARHGAAHAQARVGVDVVGADQALGQLVEDIVVLGQQLARHVETHRVRAMGLQGLGKGARGPVQRIAPRDGMGHSAALGAQQGLQQPGLARDGGAGGLGQR